MAGLLGMNEPDPLTLGLLGFSQAISTPRSRGGGVAAALGAFPAGQMQAAQMQRQREQDAMRQQLMQAQIGNYASDAEYRRAQGAALTTKAEQDAAAAAAAAAARADFEDAYKRSGGQWTPELTLLGGRAGIKGEDLERYARGGNLGREKLAWQNGVGVNPITGQPEAVVPDVNQPFAPVIGPDRQITAAPNQQVQDFKVRQAAAGATNIGLPKVEVKMGDSVGGQVGPILAASRTQTEGAVKMADSADRILSAIDKGGVIAGPTASLRLKGAQVASMLGIGGKDSVAQTRQVIRGLAEMSVEARKELAGQGQVTENEARAVDKAMSGNVDDLTVEEIRDIARLTLRASVMRASQHAEYLRKLPDSMRPAEPFYQIRGMDRVLGIDPRRYAITPPTSPGIAPDGRSASGQVGQPSVNDLLEKYGR